MSITHPKTINMNFQITEWEDDGDYYLSIIYRKQDEGVVSQTDSTIKSGTSKPFISSLARRQWLNSWLDKGYYVNFDGKIFPDWGQA